MNALQQPDEDRLIDLLERAPGRFEPTTALRVAMGATGALTIRAHTGTQPAALAVDRVQRNGPAFTVRSVLAGLVGTLGALPPAYNELVLREERNRSRGFAAFLDMFGERIVEFFVQASEKYRLARLLRWTGTDNGISRSLFALTGFGTARLRQRNRVGDDVLLRFSGFFSSRVRNASNLRAMLAEFIGLAVEVELFRGQWLPVPSHEQSRLGRADAVRLGANAMAGAAVRDFTRGFRIVIGPVGYADYLSLAPGTERMQSVFDLTRLFVGPALDFDVQVILRKEEVPFCRLGEAGNPPRLGWNSWARIAQLEADSRDAIVVQRAGASTSDGRHAP